MWGQQPFPPAGVWVALGIEQLRLFEEHLLIVSICSCVTREFCLQATCWHASAAAQVMMQLDSEGMAAQQAAEAARREAGKLGMKVLQQQMQASCVHQPLLTNATS